MALAQEIGIAKTNAARAFNKKTLKLLAEGERREATCTAFYDIFRKWDTEKQQNTITYLTSIMEGWNDKPLSEQMVDEIIRDSSGDYTVQAAMLKEMRPGGF